MPEFRIDESAIQAGVDARLEPGERAGFERWLAAHPAEAERVAALRQITDALRREFEPVLDETIPEALLGARPRPRIAAWAKAAAWAGLGVALGAALGWRLHVPADESAALPRSPLAHHAAIAHATYSPEVRHPVEVGADQEAHLVAWLSKRVGVPLRAPKLDAEQFSLVGGRLLPGEPGPVAHFMYQCSNGRRVTLYIAPPPAGNAETAFRYTREDKVNVFYWVDKRIGYALSSTDVEREELLGLANVVYKQLNP
jgi:anti-sigma factor RsiW